MALHFSDLQSLDYSALAGWEADGQSAAFAAFRRSALHSLVKPYRTGSLGVEAGAFSAAFAEARAVERLTDGDARVFFERHFRPCLIPGPGGEDGFVTGFYEPEVEASAVRSERFRYPVYRRPADLVDVDGTNRPADLDPSFAFGRLEGGRLTEYWDRVGIEQGALAGRGLELAWLADRVDLFFVHVQGAARLRFGDATTRRITYAAKTGHPFTGPGRVLAGLGEIPPGDVTMQSIRAWLGRNPHRIDEILWRNRSFIFFREAAVEDQRLGPVAAAKVPLTAGRSMAVDRLIHTFATPFHVEAPTLEAFGPGGFRRLMIAQDTGSAIVGPARGDLFTGSGDAAGEIAGVIRHPARFVALLPRRLFEGAR